MAEKAPEEAVAQAQPKEEVQPAVYDARKLGAGKMGVLGLQHMFAMFGATVLVPLLTGLDVATTLLFAGVGTLLFHLLTKGKVPAFLGSSFAFLAGYYFMISEDHMSPATVSPAIQAMIPYACLGVACAGVLYLILSLLFKIFGVKAVMRYFPPVVTGPIIICVGLQLASSAIGNCSQNWLVAIIAVVIIIVCSIWAKGMIKIIPILMGVIGAYIVAACMGLVDWSGVREAAWIGLPVVWDNTVFSLIGNPTFDAGLALTAIITIVPIALATMVEHIGDICAISSTCEKNFIEDPGLHRTLLGDGLATIVASLFGAPANTTYGENTGVLVLTRVFDPRVVRLAACFAIIMSFCPKFAAVIGAMPGSVVGGISLVLYGMIAAVGVRNLIENQVDFTKSRNVLVAALILVLSLGIVYSGPIVFTVGAATIKLTGLAVGSLVGIILNAILPGKDYDFDKRAAEGSLAAAGTIVMEPQGETTTR